MAPGLPLKEPQNRRHVGCFGEGGRKTLLTKSALDSRSWSWQLFFLFFLICFGKLNNFSERSFSC